MAESWRAHVLQTLCFTLDHRHVSRRLDTALTPGRHILINGSLLNEKMTSSRKTYKVYACRLRRRRFAHVTELPQFRQELEAICFAAECLGTLAANMLRLLEFGLGWQSMSKVPTWHF